MDRGLIKGLLVGLVAGAVAFGGIAMAQAAVPVAVGAAVSAAATSPPVVQRCLAGPLGVLAKLTGLSVEEIRAQRRSGKSISDIAKSKNVSEQQFIDQVLAARKAALDVRVKQGVITQKQADEILAFMRDRMKKHFESTAPGRGSGLGGCPGGGAAGSVGGPGGCGRLGDRGAGYGFGPVQGGVVPQ